MKKIRIITAQGPTQLINVIAVLSYQRAYEGQEFYDDHLILGGMSGGKKIHSELCKVCREIARAWSFASIQEYDECQNLNRNKLNFDELLAHYLSSINIPSCDVIYICRNWQLFNELALNAYPSAKRICYGDGFGTLDLDGGITYEESYSPKGFLPLHEAYLFFPMTKDPVRNYRHMIDVIIEPSHDLLISIIRKIATGIPELVTICRSIDTCSENNYALILTSTFTEGSYFKRNPIWHMIKCLTINFVSVITFGKYKIPFHSNSNLEILIYLSQLKSHDLKEMRVLVKGHPRQRFRQSEILTKSLNLQKIDAFEVNDLQYYPIELVACLIPFKLIIAFGSSSAATLSLICPNCKIDALIKDELRTNYFRKSFAEWTGPKYSYYLSSMNSMR